MSAAATLLLGSMGGAPASAADGGGAGARMDAATAKALLKRPKGSISLGTTGSGRLLGGVELPYEGEGYAVFRSFRQRKTNFATSEMVSLLQRATRRVTTDFPGSKLGFGNCGFEDGGKIPWSVSHRAGRDCDLGMYALDSRGRPVELVDFVTYDADGQARGGRYHFDVKRNLALVVALVTDEVPVQYIFVADWLKSKLLDEARAQGLPTETQTRLGEILHQPSDSNPHANHFHVRVFCSTEDRLEGCRNWGPEYPWVDLGDGPWRARVAALARIVDEVGDAKLRREALQRIGEIDGVPALPTLLAALGDADDGVRNAALSAIRSLQDPATIAGLLGAIATTPDGRWASKLFDAIAATHAPEAVPIALRAVAGPEALLHPDAVKDAAPRVTLTACRVLGRYGKKDAAPPLLALLEAPDKDIRLAAHDALLRVTNQRISSRGLESSRERRREKVVAAWRGFYDEAKDESWLHWLRLGFEARRIRFQGRMQSPGGVEKLIDAISNKDDIASDNAVRALSEITGHYVDPAWRNKRNNQRHWRSWWSDNGATVAFP